MVLDTDFEARALLPNAADSPFQRGEAKKGRYLRPFFFFFIQNGGTSPAIIQP
jgi:hypothetical protein